MLLFFEQMAARVAVPSAQAAGAQMASKLVHIKELVSTVLQTLVGSFQAQELLF